MTTTVEDWALRAEALADAISSAGVPLTPEWRAAVTSVPRHELVPVFFEQERGQWVEIRGDDPKQHERWLDAAYSPKTLVTHVTDGEATSSSTTPTLMLRMLHWLDVHDHHRVLEIGTGTGYNAALLSARLGGGRVFSVDVEPELVELARQRLADIGYWPTLAAVNGAEGLPQHAQYDRIIATCSVPLIPWVWAEQVRDSGLVLADLKLAMNAGNLVSLRRYPDRLEGHFVDRWGSFMSLRSQPTQTQSGQQRPQRADGPARERETAVRKSPWFDDLVPWFMLNLNGTVGHNAVVGMSFDEQRGTPSATHLVDVDGSWCEIAVSEGPRTVRQGGPRNLWDSVEATYNIWEQLHRPGWDRLGLTVTPTTQHVWVDEPDGPASWTVCA